MARANTPSPDWVALAVITAPHGVSGRVKVKSFTEPPRGFAEYEAIGDAQGKPVRFRITGEAQGLFIIQIEGITTRDQAELLRGRELGIARSALPELAKNEFYFADLIGLPVTTIDGTAFGTVRDLQNFGAGDVVEIELATGGREWFAFNDATFPHVDVAAGQLIIDPPLILGSKDEEEGAA